MCWNFFSFLFETLRTLIRKLPYIRVSLWAKNKCVELIFDRSCAVDKQKVWNSQENCATLFQQNFLYFSLITVHFSYVSKGYYRKAFLSVTVMAAQCTLS